MTNPFYNATGNPTTNAPGASATIRAEFDLIEAGFDLMPSLPLPPGAALIVDPTGQSFAVTAGALALAGNFTTTGIFSTTLVAGANVSLTLPLVNGTLATLAGTETLTNKTLVAPALGTPASGVLTNCTGTAAGLTAGHVTTNANLTGPITSSGNTTSVNAQTGTGSTFVMAASPTLVTPNLGTPTAGNLASCTGFPTGTAATTYMGGDVALSNTGTFFNGPSTGSIGAAGQTFEITAKAIMTDSAGAANFVAQLWNGSAAVDTGGDSLPFANGGVIVILSVIVTLSAATTFTLQAKDITSTSGTLLRSQIGASTANLGTNISYKRLS